MFAGIDEAGRGPVIGPMVMAVVAVDDDSELVKLGVKDSKLLSPKKREMMFERIKSIAKDYRILKITPKQIDEALTSPALNLNKLEALTSAKLLNEVKADKAILDCPSSSSSAFVRDVREYLEYEPEIVSEHKADLNHPVVAAASILAKVTRDREIEALKKKTGHDFGSGYPADPKTRSFLVKNYNKYDIFRKSWSSYKKVASARKQGRLGKFK
ncbi:MAG: ribonuclease HII [Nanobdellota archaeon]